MSKAKFILYAIGTVLAAMGSFLIGWFSMGGGTP